MVKPITKLEMQSCPGVENYKPHPDGQPWPRCCGNKADKSCLCFMRKPKNRPSRHDTYEGQFPGIPQLTARHGRFFCVHRFDNGFVRECAGWYAKFGRHRHNQPTENHNERA